MKNKILLIFFLICFSITTFSQQYFFKNYGVDEGISSSEIFDIIQAKDRTLWLATYFGVSNFNGSEFINYNKENGLSGNIVRTVFEDSKNRIWIGFWSDGINYIENGKVHKISGPILEKYPSAIQFFETKDGTIWIFGSKAIMQYKNNEVTLVYTTKGPKDYAIPNDVIQTKDGIIWVATLGRGIAKIIPSPFSIEMINDTNSNINNICYSLFEDKDGSIWIGSYGAIFNYKNKKLIAHNLQGKGHRNRVWSIAEDYNGKLWLGLYGNGMAIFDKKDSFQIINSSNGLGDDYTYKLIIDSENNKWLISQNNGLSKFRDFAFVYYSEKDGIPNKQINDFAVSKGDTLVLATKRGIVSFFDGTFFNEKIKEEYVHAVAYDANNDLWCTTTKKYGKVAEKLNDHLIEETFYDIILRNDSTLVFAGEFNIQEIKNDKSQTKRFFDLRARDLMNLGNKTIIATTYALKEYKNNSVKNIDDLPKTINSFLEISQLSDTEFFAGTLDELVYVKLIDTTYTYKLYSRNKFPSIRDFNSLYVDGNNLWVGSSSSLSKIDIDYLLNKDSIVVETYGKDIGFIKGEPGKAITKIKNSIYLGTSNGLLEFTPSKFNKSTVPPDLKIKETVLFSENFNDSLYLKNKVLTFPYNKNHLTFKLSAVSLTYPENIKYKYRLKGLRDSKWSEPTKKSEVIYSYLPSGNYTFEFTADNGFGVWQETPKTYNFVIQLPFWKTDWFKFLASGSFLFLGLSFVYFTQRKKKIEQKKYTMALLEAQEKDRKRVSKELHDGVGQKLLLIKNSLTLNPTKTSGLVDSTIEDIRSISRNLHPMQLEKFGLTKAIENMVEDLNELTSIFFSDEIDNIDDFFPKEKEIYLYRIIQECINNIIKHSDATAARIIAKKEGNKVIVTIQDNGKGFNLDESLKKQKSFGLKSLQERVDFLKGKIIFNTEENKGTIVTITSYK